MTAFSFQTVAHLVVEPGLVRRLGALLRERYAGERAVLVTDAFLHRSGALQPALDSLAATGWQTLVIDDVVADPPEAVVEAAAARTRAFNADMVIGFGGGSSMDVAKLVAVLCQGDQPLSAMYGINQVHGKRLPLVQVPTTAGTGSEVTPISIVTTGATTKSGVVAPQLYANAAFLDAELTVGLPPAATAATGVDAMVHAIEAYTSKRLKNPLSDHLAVLALKLLSANLLTVCRDGGNLQARSDMLLGAMLAGQAFANAPVGGVHALAYPVGGIFHVPHGLSNALVLPAVLHFNAQAAAPLYAELGVAVGLPPSADAASGAAAFIAFLEDLIRQAQLPQGLRAVGITEADLPALASSAMVQQRLLMNNPLPIDEAQALAIYRAAY
ncbi:MULTISPECIES: iron-containing alcohol dehydrogenase [Achromobacter]|uniref:Iron-containing alcohol dehydrogenase n=1 Tax=Achromobacter spanius TaxID=217203 RepID=A0ABY8GPQ9_9BURK|nr:MULTISPECIES: iron-containing alcohol dehydrogenase [Achromobacter]WAI83917.1 iron-containing alcohol dehydrogenase [Achromobacter spanius]WEX93997.1 iron-containing alcohol dehydrogenase [Achromobacter sp. SS2-2022]WFP06838.1 iron-containing alcohol dehydrogenase [Achromobacter spanius]